jgi:hypothetical protein
MSAGATVSLRRAAHARTGDKGNRSNIGVFAYHSDLYPHLVEQVTEAKVAQLFAHRRPSAVRRYLLPKLGAMNFVIDDVLDGGVNNSLNLDSHGKTLALLILEMTVTLPQSVVPLLQGEEE